MLEVAEIIDIISPPFLLCRPAIAAHKAALPVAFGELDMKSICPFTAWAGARILVAANTREACIIPCQIKHGHHGIDSFLKMTCPFCPFCPFGALRPLVERLRGKGHPVPFMKWLLARVHRAKGQKGQKGQHSYRVPLF